MEITNPIHILHNFLPIDGSSRLVKYSTFMQHFLESIEEHTGIEIKNSEQFEKLLQLLVDSGLVELEYEKPDRVYIKRGIKLKHGT